MQQGSAALLLGMGTAVALGMRKRPGTESWKWVVNDDYHGPKEDPAIFPKENTSPVERDVPETTCQH